MGRYTTIEVDVDIEDYLDDLDYDVLLDECIRRIPKNRREKQKRKELFDTLELELEDLIELFIKIKGLSLIQAMKLKEVINEL